MLKLQKGDNTARGDRGGRDVNQMEETAAHISDYRLSKATDLPIHDLDHIHSVLLTQPQISSMNNLFDNSARGNRGRP
jgi:hypothetical protein